MCIPNEPRKSRKHYATRHKEICKLPKVLEINSGTLQQQHARTHQASSEPLKSAIFQHAAGSSKLIMNG